MANEKEGALYHFVTESQSMTNILMLTCKTVVRDIVEWKQFNGDAYQTRCTQHGRSACEMGNVTILYCINATAKPTKTKFISSLDKCYKQIMTVWHLTVAAVSHTQYKKYLTTFSVKHYDTIDGGFWEMLTGLASYW